MLRRERLYNSINADPYQDGRRSRQVSRKEMKKMDAIVSPLKQEEKLPVERPSREEAEAAVRTLLAWAGEDPEREGLIDTPKRVAKAYEELFGGYELDAEAVLGRTFEDVGGYGDIVLVRDIPFYSHCEHHLLPFVGKAHVAYYPSHSVVGLSKIARVVDIYARRMQTQENMTAQISNVVDETLKPRGVAVLIEASHQCMAMRGIQKAGALTITTQYTGVFKDDPAEQQKFQSLINHGK